MLDLQVIATLQQHSLPAPQHALIWPAHARGQRETRQQALAREQRQRQAGFTAPASSVSWQPPQQQRVGDQAEDSMDDSEVCSKHLKGLTVLGDGGSCPVEDLNAGCMSATHTSYVAWLLLSAAEPSVPLLAHSSAPRPDRPCRRNVEHASCNNSASQLMLLAWAGSAGLDSLPARGNS